MSLNYFFLVEEGSKLRFGRVICANPSRIGFRNEFLTFTSENEVDLDELHILKITFRNGLEIGMENFPQHFLQNLSQDFPQDFPARFSCKIFPQDFSKLDPDWLAPYYPIPNAKFPQITAFLKLAFFPPPCPTRLSRKIFPQDFPARFSHKNFLQDFPASISRKIFLKEFPTRFSCKIFLQDFPTRFF